MCVHECVHVNVRVYMCACMYGYVNISPAGDCHLVWYNYQGLIYIQLFEDNQILIYLNKFPNFFALLFNRRH